MREPRPETGSAVSGAPILGLHLTAVRLDPTVLTMGTESPSVASERPQRTDRWAGAWFLLGATGIVAFAIAGCRIFDPSQPRTALIGLFCFLGACLAQVAGWWGALRLPMGRRGLGAIILVGIVARGVLLSADPVLSDDIYRYLWEGRIQSLGFNPFTISPADERLMLLRDEVVYPQINHPEVSAIYPPALQLLFRGTAALASTVLAFKILSVLADLATGCLLLMWLRDRRRSLAWGIVWWWSPLVLIEFAWSGHADSVGIAALVAALWSLDRSRVIAGVSSLALAIGAKLLPVLFVPRFLVSWGWRTLWIVPLLVVMTLPYVWESAWTRDRGGLLYALDQYGTHWRFNDALFRVPFEALREISAWLEPSAHPGEHEVFANVWARRFAALVVGGLSFWVALRAFDPARAALWILGAFVLLTPTLHPWYVTWLIPWLCFRPVVSWWCLSALVVISYRAVVLREMGSGWQEESWVWWVQFVPFVLVASVEVYHHRRGDRSPFEAG